MALDWIVRIIIMAIISWITVNAYNGGLRGLWLIGYVALCAVVVYGMIALVVAFGAVWIVVLVIGFTIIITSNI